MRSVNLPSSLHLAGVFLKIFFRDRSAFVLGTLFPLIFLAVLGGMRVGAPVVMKVGLADLPAGQHGVSLQQLPGFLAERPELDLQQGDLASLMARLEAGELQAVLVPLASTGPAEPTRVQVLITGNRSTASLFPLLQSALVDVERQLLGTQAVFVFEVAGGDQLTYVEFLLPGLLAFSIMQISFAGSGYNLVEYRRKGILKRLFVTPLRPVDFILAISLARTLFCLAQLALVLLFARLVLGVQILGSVLELLLFIALGCFIFLCLGFALGSIARTQQVIGALGSLITFPQVILSGVFFPLEMMPELVQLPASWLPLTFIVEGLREVISNGSSLASQPHLPAGALVWCGITFGLATWLFDWKRLAN